MAHTWEEALDQILQELAAMHPGGGRWDFGVAFISGFDSQNDAVVGVTAKLDKTLGTEGGFLGVASAGSIGRSQERQRLVLSANDSLSSITVTAVRLPRQADGTLGEGVQEARPFVVGKEELMQISQLALNIQDSSRSDPSGNIKSARHSTPLAWRKFLGQEGEHEAKSMLLFADPTTSQYVEENVLGGLDLAFPKASKVGGVCTHLRPSGRLAASPGAGLPPVEVEGKIAGIILPSSVAIHALVTRSAFAMGQRLEITKAQGHIVTEINGESPQKVLQDIRKTATPLEEVLIGRSGFLLGVESPKEPEASNTNVSGNLPPSVTRGNVDSKWLMRSFEAMPGGELYVRNHDFKSIPRKVGLQRKTIQLHVQDEYQTRESGRLMLERYGGARMMMDSAPACFGVLTFQCPRSQPGTAGLPSADEHEEQLRSMLGLEELAVAGCILRGEFGPTGMALGGYDAQRTARHSHTVTTCVLCYSAPKVGVAGSLKETLRELQAR
jgi:small ligand-binding sensory domain FIST